MDFVILDGSTQHDVFSKRENGESVLCLEDNLFDTENQDCHPEFTFQPDNEIMHLSSPIPFLSINQDGQEIDEFANHDYGTSGLTSSSIPSYSSHCGISSQHVKLIRVVLFVNQCIDKIRSLCDEVSLSLSQYSIFCEISVYSKEDSSFVLEHIHCDICITDKESINLVSLSYPNVCCSFIDYSNNLSQHEEDVLFSRICNIIQLYIKENKTMNIPIQYSSLYQLSNILLPSISS